MRIGYMSDLHVEMWTRRQAAWCGEGPLCWGPDVRGAQADVVILAGDIGLARDGSAPDYRLQLEQYLGVPVFLVPGNHEYYGSDFQLAHEKLIGHEDILDRRAVNLGALRILAATLWTDYAVAGDQSVALSTAAGVLNDHKVIRINSRAFHPKDALLQHATSRQWLVDRLAERHNGHTLIVTHHCPHPAVSNTKFPLDALSGAFCSNCDDVIEVAARAGVGGWIFGHDHHCCDMAHGGVRFLSAQRGYPGEDTGWTGMGILTI